MTSATDTVLVGLACDATKCVCHASEKAGHGLTHCPTHDDRTPSLNVSLSKGTLVVKCHAGCAQDVVWGALRDRDLLPPPPERAEIVATYDYTDEAGALLFQVVRFAPKDFRQRKPDGAGDWLWSLNGVRRVLYRLPDVAVAIRMGEPVYITEGEKDADALRAKGLIATSGSGGAGNWRTEYAESLRGAKVIIVQDKDEAGYKHAADVYASLSGVAASVRVVEAITGKDAFDHLAAGHGVDDFAPAKPHHAAAPREHWQLGGPFILDAPLEVPCLWGQGDEVLMAEGESLFVVGPAGVGKSSIVQQLVLGFIGLRIAVLGYPVVPAAGNVLYLAMDRPQQIRRSFRRMVIEEDRPLLDARLRFWPGPLHFDPLTKPEELLALCYAVGATHLVVDSLKDLAIGLNKDDVAGQVNRLFQFLTAGGIQLVVIHHQRKEQADNKKPTKLADVYGNQQIVNGAGSVIILWGEAGDGTIELDHLKQPASPVGPFNIVHNHAIGFTEVESSPGDALTILRGATNGLVADGIARYMFGTEKPSRAQVERARRRAENLVMKQLAHTTQEESSIRGGRPIVRYFATDTRHGEG